jgi:glycerate kinase
MGAAFMAFFNAKLRIGADIILDFLDINETLNGADLVIVGEGQFDRSTVFNKAPVSVASRAKERGIPVIGIAGSLGVGFEEVHNHGIDSVFSLVNRPMSLNDAVKNTDRLVEIATEEACRAIKIGMRSS